MAKKLGIIITTFCLILLFTLPASAAVYTWKDKDGNSVVSSSPPPPEATSQKSDKEAAQAGEDIPTGKKQDSTLESKEKIPPRSKEGARQGQEQIGRRQGSGPASSGEIHDAAKNGDLKKVKALLKGNPDLIFSKNNNNGGTPLHFAASGGRNDVAKLLLANKADVNAKAKGGFTPLHFAVTNSQKEMAKLLLANKADVNARGMGGMTPLHFAAGQGLTDMAALLIANKADVNARNDLGMTPLRAVATESPNVAWVQKDRTGVVSLLLANHADADARDNMGVTPLHAAALDDQKDIAALLLANKADVNAKENNGGETPLHMAAMMGHKDVVALLLANHAAVNAKDNCGATPLRLALEGREGASKLMGKDAYDLVFPDKPGLKGDLKATAELLRQHGGIK